MLTIKYLIYFNLILCILGVFGLKYIYKFKWSSTLIRNLTVILLIIGIILSGISFLIENSKKDPNDEFYDALLVLEKKTGPRDVILSHPNYGVYINAISKRKNFVDINYAYAPRRDLRLFHLDKIFYSISLTNTLKVFNEFNVDYVLITPEMKNGLVWSRGNEGLLYLLETYPNFKLTYEKDGFEIWRVS
tara:strand:+ start:38 stop:607 length:570 start_codon:yes stop_codon:yes gene_type:complete